MHTFRLLLSALAIGTLLAVPQALLAQSSGIESLTSQDDID